MGLSRSISDPSRDEDFQLCCSFQNLSSIVQNLSAPTAQKSLKSSSLLEKKTLLNKLLTLLLDIPSNEPRMEIPCRYEQAIGHQFAAGARSASPVSSCWALEELVWFVLADVPRLIGGLCCALIITKYESHDEHLRRVIGRLLSECLISYDTRRSTSRSFSPGLFAMLPAPTPWNCVEPSQIESCLILWGHRISAGRKGKEVWTPEQLVEFRKWKITIRKALEDTNVRRL